MIDKYNFIADTLSKFGFRKFGNTDYPSNFIMGIVLDIVDKDWMFDLNQVLLVKGNMIIHNQINQKYLPYEQHTTSLFIIVDGNCNISTTSSKISYDEFCEVFVTNPRDRILNEIVNN